jgi:hypothetical protein
MQAGRQTAGNYSFRLHTLEMGLQCICAATAHVRSQDTFELVEGSALPPSRVYENETANYLAASA